MKHTFIAALATTLLLGCTIEAKSAKRKPVPVQSAGVEAPHTVGVILPKRSLLVTAPRNATVQVVHTEPGDRVKKGQLLATLFVDAPGGQPVSAIAARENALSMAKARLDRSQQRVSQQEHFAIEQAKQDRERQLLQLKTGQDEMDAKLREDSGLIENSVFNLIDTTTNLLYTRMDALQNHEDFTPFDYHRRKEVYYTDQLASKAFEQELHNLFRTVNDTRAPVPTETLLKNAGEVGRDARLLVHNLRPSPGLSEREIDLIREDIERATDSVNRLAVDHAETRSKMESARQAEALVTSQNLLVPPAVQFDTVTDAEIVAIEDDIRRLRRSGGGTTFTVTAPSDGIIVQQIAEEGNPVFPGDPLFSLADDTEHLLRFSVDEVVLHAVRRGSEVAFQTINSPSEQRRAATIARIEPIVDPEERTVQIEAKIRGELPEHTLFNAQAYVFLPLLPEAPNLTTIPERAVSWSGDQDTVWVISPTGEPQERPVRTAYRYQENAYIARGLREGERVLLPVIPSERRPFKPLETLLGFLKQQKKEAVATASARKQDKKTEGSLLQKRLERRERRKGESS